jgi:tRNA-dihydrouridine synthase B
MYRPAYYIVGMIIGNLNIGGHVFCAPMAGISTSAYRLLARRFGAAVVYTEMVSSDSIIRNNKKSNELLNFGPLERPIGFQLFGNNPEIMHRAIRIVSKWKPDIIDLNLCCPVRKIVRNNHGAAILKDLGLTRALVEAAVAATGRPITVKIRSGWDESARIFADAGRIAERAGAAAVTLHARTRSAGFGGKASWEDITRLKEAISIPVVGNGDIACGEDAQRMFDQTGCDAVMVGRAAIGNPWIFQEINYYLKAGNSPAQPTLEERIDIIVEHARLLADANGEKRAILKMRGILPRYVRGWIGGRILRQQATKIDTLSDLKTLLDEYMAN